MSADLRRFEYSLEPVRKQRRWTLDSLQAELGRAQKQVEEAEEALRDLRGQCVAGCERAARGLAERLDPATHPRALGWLVRVRKEIQETEERLRKLRQLRARLRAECSSQERKVEVIERHRQECVESFTQQEEQRLSRDADRDWLSRVSTEKLAGGVEGGDT